MKNEGICTALALYDLDIDFCQNPKNMKGLFYYLEDWMNKHNWPPIRMGVNGENLPKTTKTKTFSSCKKSLERNEFKLVTDFWIGATPPEHIYDMSDSYLATLIELKKNYTAFYIYFHNDVIPHDWDYVEQVMKDIAQWIKAGYGIAYQRDFDKGPGLYVSGMITGPDSYCDSEDTVIKHERQCIGRWFNTYGDPEDYHHGDLRDIYPLNFLSKAHLERPAGDQTLKQWIESSPNHGVLKPLTDILWSWRVVEDQISDVRESLRPYGFILCI